MGVYKYPEIEITKEELARAVYFILMKYSSDPLHLQGTSSKRDLIGGFIERWLNKLAETAVFDVLLKGKPYVAVPDYFIYNNESKKDAPDIIGIKNKERTIPFVQYNNGTWETVDKRPRIEVKVYRKDQYVVGVREQQMIDDFYVFVESDLSPDYLTMLFDDSLFNVNNLEALKNDPVFIKSNSEIGLISPTEPKKAERVGTFRLIGVYTKEQLLKNTTICPQGVSPWYVKNVSAVANVRGKNCNEKVIVTDGKICYSHGDSVYLPIAVEGNTLNISLIKKNKGSFYLNSEFPISINGEEPLSGDIGISMAQMERSSNWSEYVAIKKSFEVFAEDSAGTMVKLLDEINKSE